MAPPFRPATRPPWTAQSAPLVPPSTPSSPPVYNLLLPAVLLVCLCRGRPLLHCQCLLPPRSPTPLLHPPAARHHRPSILIRTSPVSRTRCVSFSVEGRAGWAVLLAVGLQQTACSLHTTTQMRNTTYVCLLLLHLFLLFSPAHTNRLR